MHPHKYTHPHTCNTHAHTQHLQDLTFIYNKYKCENNTLVGHCYGGVHVLRLIKQLDDQGRSGEISNLIILCLGDKCVPGSVFGSLPAGLLGECFGIICSVELVSL